MPKTFVQIYFTPSATDITDMSTSQGGLKFILSDHLMQGFTTSLVSPGKTYVQLAHRQWNLCARANVKNNPWRTIEKEAEFKQRKMDQLAVILADIEKSETEAQGEDRSHAKLPLSFFNLQEVDFIDIPEVFVVWQQALIDKGWGIISSKPKHSIRQPMMILYNRKRLKPVGEEVALFPTRTQENCALACDFDVLDATKEPRTVTIVNADLAAGESYHEAIDQYQKAQVLANKMTIIAGDFNTPPDHNVPGMIGDSKRATALIFDASKEIQMSATENNCATFYDTCLASPTKDTCVVVAETSMRSFIIVDEGSKEKIYLKVLDPIYAAHPEHTSRIGEPWRKDQVYHLEDFYELCALINAVIPNLPKNIINAYKHLILSFLTKQAHAESQSYDFEKIIKEWFTSYTASLKPTDAQLTSHHSTSFFCPGKAIIDKEFVDSLLTRFGPGGLGSKLSPLPIEAARMPKIFQGLKSKISMQSDDRPCCVM